MISAMHKSWAIAIFAALALSACSTQPGTIFRLFSLDDGKSFTTGARQRVVSNIRPGIGSRPGRVDPNHIICVEPSPDVAIAIANSFGAGLSILGQGSGSVSGAQAEGIAQLAERTVAIQALLKQGYQACLDYANGAISGTTYSLRTSRLDDLMVTLILAEVAGGAFGRSGAAIGTKASASASAKLAEGLREDFDTAKAELAKANVKVANAETKLTEAESATPQVPDDVKTAKQELKVAKAERDAARQLMTASADTAAQAAAEVNEIIALGGLTPKPDAAIAKELGLMQERFINKDIDQAYIQTCLVELGNWKKSNELEKEYQRYALDLIKISGPITKAGSIPFFVGGIFENANELTEHCKDNLGPFVVQVQADRQVLKLRQLENEGKRLDILSLQAATPKETFGKFIHPRASYNLLGEDKTKLEAKKGTLTAKPVPDVSAVANAIVTQATHARLDREKTTLLAAIAALIQKAGDTLTDDRQGTGTHAGTVHQ